MRMTIYALYNRVLGSICHWVMDELKNLQYLRNGMQDKTKVTVTV